MLTWELGHNLGHLARLREIAVGLKSRGHSVLVSVRDAQAASVWLGSAGVPFCQAVPAVLDDSHSVTRILSYADILRVHGWGDIANLSSQVQGWLEQFRRFDPDIVVFDYSPAARLAARILRLPCMLIGNGFDLPPAAPPLPPFPGFSAATAERAEASEAIVVRTANVVITALGAKPIKALGELLQGDATFLLTLPELDPYGPRTDATFVGPLDKPVTGREVLWPERDGLKVFAYLRPEIPGLNHILESLTSIGASTICYLPGSTARFSSDPRNAMQLHPQPINYSALLGGADICVTYAALGTVTQFLLAGVRQLLIPTSIEKQLTARCVENIGAGVTIRGSQTASSRLMIEILRREPNYKERAAAFSKKYESINAAESSRRVVEGIEQIIKMSLSSES